MVEEKLAFNLSNIHQQEFPFLEKLIKYINESADAEIKQMLDRSCKYFYKELPFLIIDSLEINHKKLRLENEAYGGCMDYIDYNELEHFLKKVDNIWVTKKVNVSGRLGRYIQKIVRCDAFELSIFFAYLEFGTFRKLTKSGKVEHLDITDARIVYDLYEFFGLPEASSTISDSDMDSDSDSETDLASYSDSDSTSTTSSVSDFDSDIDLETSSIDSDMDYETSSIISDYGMESGIDLNSGGNISTMSEASSYNTGIEESRAPLEDILTMVPNARIIRVGKCHVTEETMTKLISIPWKNKITEFSLNHVDGPLCVDSFYEFVKRHVDSKAKIHVGLNNMVDDFAFPLNYNFKVLESAMLYTQKVFKSLEAGLRNNQKACETVDCVIRSSLKVLQSVEYGIDNIQKVLESRKKMPTFEIADPPVDMEILPTPEDEKKKITFNDENAERQYFAFPYPHMCYIRENADGEIWKKFERTCKFFYPKNSYFMVDNLHVEADDGITLMVDNNKKYLFRNYEEVKNVGKPLWITNSIDITFGGDYDLSSDNRIQAPEIILRHLTLTKNLLISLTKYGLVKIWNSYYSSIVYDNERVLSLNELLVHLPNAESISAKIHGINYQNAIEPASLLQQNKIKYLKLRFVNESIQAHQLYDILTTSLAPKALVKVNLIKLVRKMDVPQFKAEMKEKLDTWKPQIEKPSFKIVS